MGTVFYKTLKALFHVLLGSVLGEKKKKILAFRKNALTESAVRFIQSLGKCSVFAGRAGSAAVICKVG